jgi:Tol biopolymer transport system component
MNEDGTNVRRVSYTPDSAIDFGIAVWSPTLSEIAVTWNYNDIRAREYRTLSILDTTQGILKDLAYPEGYSTPIWNPGGNEIAYNFDGINIINVSTRVQRKITSPKDTFYWAYDWSQDGSRILAGVYTGNAYHIIQTCDLWEIDVNGKLLKQIVKTDSIFEYYGRWSPEGSKIGVVYHRPGDYYTQKASGIYTIMENGTDLKTLVPEVRFYPGQKLYPELLCWSPNSKQIVFINPDSGNYSCVINNDGTEMRLLFKGTITDWR